MRPIRAALPIVSVLLAAAACSPGVGRDDERRYTGERTEDYVVLKAPGGKPILRYQREPLPAGETAPSVEGAGFTHPIWTPAGAMVSDLAPKDHPHHRGVFCGWVAMDGEKPGDWWGWGAKAPKEGRSIVNREARLTEESDERVTLRAINSWRAEGETVLAERLTLTARTIPGANVIDYEYKFTTPTRKEVVIAENPFGGFCYRAKPRGELTVSGPGGPLKTPDAVFDRAARNWAPSHWYDLTYKAPDGGSCGTAVMDHPSNPHSTWHVVRGIHMLNPCIAAEGPQTIRFGEPLYLKYRLVVHDGEPNATEMQRLFDEFSEMD